MIWSVPGESTMLFFAVSELSDILFSADTDPKPSAGGRQQRETKRDELTESVDDRLGGVGGSAEPRRRPTPTRYPSRELTPW